MNSKHWRYMEITRANTGNEKKIIELQRMCYQENAERYKNYKIPPLTETEDELKEVLKENTVLIAIDNNRIVGSIRAKPIHNTCYIGRVIVHPDFQNKGIGSKLMKEIEDSYSNTERFELFTGYRDEKNLYFYKKNGYKEFKQEIINDTLVYIYLEKKRNPTSKFSRLRRLQNR